MDTYAWIEYLDGSPRGARVRDIVDNVHNNIVTSPITIAEIVSKYRRGNRDPSRALSELEHASTVPPVDMATARMAGEIHALERRTQKDFPLADAFVAATARTRQSKILTGDPHFEKFPEAITI
ncbi:MAG TPA: PIN domain-containing protein [Candidatus Bathyarchaeia archaeon]|nr:PIN domain-containing protein [Candidatus Bathyarchaeia archaeon]